MTQARVTLDHAGIRQILRSGPMQAMTRQAGERIASAVRGSGLVARSAGQAGGPAVPADVRVVDAIGHDGRPVSQVSLVHPAAIAWQARYGVMTQAVRALGAGVDWTGR
jgi:hypothetical protein